MVLPHLGTIAARGATRRNLAGFSSFVRGKNRRDTPFVRAARGGGPGDRRPSLDRGALPANVESTRGGPRKASGGSRTRNPRITNAVLCQLKLRWQVYRRQDTAFKTQANAAETN